MKMAQRRVAARLGWRKSRTEVALICHPENTFRIGRLRSVFIPLPVLRLPLQNSETEHL